MNDSTKSRVRYIMPSQSELQPRLSYKIYTTIQPKPQAPNISKVQSRTERIIDHRSVLVVYSWSSPVRPDFSCICPFHSPLESISCTKSSPRRSPCRNAKCFVPLSCRKIRGLPPRARWSGVDQSLCRCRPSVLLLLSSASAIVRHHDNACTLC